MFVWIDEKKPKRGRGLPIFQKQGMIVNWQENKWKLNLKTSMTTDLTVFDFRGGLSGSMMYSKNQDQQKITKMTKKQNGEKKKRVFRNNSKSK